MDTIFRLDEVKEAEGAEPKTVMPVPVVRCPAIVIRFFKKVNYWN